MTLFYKQYINIHIDILIYTSFVLLIVSVMKIVMNCFSYELGTTYFLWMYLYPVDNVFAQPLCHRLDVTQGQFLGGVKLVWIQNFLSWLVV